MTTPDQLRAALAELIETRLLGVNPDDQDVELDDDDWRVILAALQAPSARMLAGEGEGQRIALSAIKVIAATVKMPDVPKALGRIMAITRWAGIEAPYRELQKDERVAFQLSDAPAPERRAVAMAHETMAMGDDGSNATLKRSQAHASWVIKLATQAAYPTGAGQ